MKLVMIFAALFVVGCQEVDAAVDELTRRQFLLSSTIGWQPSDPDFDTVQVGFEDGELSLYAGCNSIFGEYELKDGKLVIDSVGMTERGCSADGLYQDRWFSTFLTSRPKLTLHENKLTLTGADATLVFLDRELANPDRPLVGPTWTVDTILSKDTASKARSSGPLTISFASDGRVGLRAACNGGSGTYSVSGDQITLTNVSFEEAACPDEGDAAQLQLVFSKPMLSFEIDAQRITLMAGDIGVSATAP